MSVRKLYYKTKGTCKVTFRVLKEDAKGADFVYLVGEFNGWNPQATPFKKFKNGNFEAVLELEKNREYQFRYLAEDRGWLNDQGADKFIATPFGDSENCVVAI